MFVKQEHGLCRKFWKYNKIKTKEKYVFLAYEDNQW